MLVATAISLPANDGRELRIKLPDYFPTINGTVRAKYEWDTDDNKHRFQVRNVRVSLSGSIVPEFLYKAEIDLCDEGKIKMLDAYVRYRPLAFPLKVTAGQMRVPFTIDAHRSPHRQYFTNRSFLARYGGNVRDVGLAVGYAFNGNVPVTIEGGIFNGSGLTNQKDYWTRRFNFSFKVTAKVANLLTMEASCQKSQPDDIGIMMWNAGAYYDDGFWHIEGEYLRKNYSHNAFKGLDIVDAFVVRRFPINGKLTAISALARYEYMGNHSSGILNEEGSLTIDQPRRQRITAGPTFTFGNSKRWVELRVNYEKYLYGSGAVIPVSDHDKLVVELMCRF